MIFILTPKVTNFFAMRKLIIVALISTLLPNLNAQNGYQTGQEISDFHLPNAANTMNGIGMDVSLSDYNNVKGYIIVFTDNTCPFSEAYEDRIVALHRKYAMKGYPVIAINPANDINPEESFEQMKLHAKEKNYPFAYLQDTTQHIAMKLGATHVAQAFVIQKKKDKNIIRYAGAIDDNTWEAAQVGIQYIADAVDHLLKGALPNRKQTLSEGCEIQWKKDIAAELTTDADLLPVKRRKRN